MDDKNTAIVQDICFSNKAHFYLNKIVNKRNASYWGSKTPIFTFITIYMVKKVHVTVLAAMSSNNRIFPLWKWKWWNGIRYLEILKKKILPSLTRRGIKLKDIWFQQDGATPHHLICYRLVAWHLMETSFLLKPQMFGALTLPTRAPWISLYWDILKDLYTNHNQTLLKNWKSQYED